MPLECNPTRVGSYIALKCWTRIELTVSFKHTCLMRRGVSTVKKIDSPGPCMLHAHRSVSVHLSFRGFFPAKISNFFYFLFR
jgi:hypothetical protein